MSSDCNNLMFKAAVARYASLLYVAVALNKCFYYGGSSAYLKCLQMQQS